MSCILKNISRLYTKNIIRSQNARSSRHPVSRYVRHGSSSSELEEHHLYCACAIHITCTCVFYWAPGATRLYVVSRAIRIFRMRNSARARRKGGRGRKNTSGVTRHIFVGTRNAISSLQRPVLVTIHVTIFN